jgi:hypothetical protein
MTSHLSRQKRQTSKTFAQHCYVLAIVTSNSRIATYSCRLFFDRFENNVRHIGDHHMLCASPKVVGETPEVRSKLRKIRRSPDPWRHPA